MLFYQYRATSFKLQHETNLIMQFNVNIDSDLDIQIFNSVSCYIKLSTKT